jgi:very-short-patch-repair endonuclease
VARTILDQAELLQPHELANLVTDVESRRLFDLRELERTIARNPGRRGIKPLRTLMARYREPPITRSDAEKLLLRLCASAGLPRPQTNVIVAGHRVDAVWPEQRLVVEVDSRTHHLTVAAFEEDRRRDADLMLAGYRVLRITWLRLHYEPREVVATLRALLGLG